MLQEVIKADLKSAMKAGKTDKVSALRYVLGEFKRLKGTKYNGKEVVGDVLTDDQAISVINKIIAAEKQVLELSRNTDVGMIELLSVYLPQTISEEEILTWLKSNVDFSKLKNKMQAVGLLKKEFGNKLDAKLASKLISGL